jgi:nucleolar protein 4
MNGGKFKGRTVALEFSLPQGRYESKRIIANTKQTREDVPLREERDRARKEERRKAAKMREGAEQKSGKTLFVRNISYDTTQEEFAQFMAKFGAVKYAVLVKAKELQAAHKGSGFVQFRDPAAAEQVIQLSKQIEERLDKECKDERLKKKAEADKKVTAKGVASVISAELELNGRRLVIM